MQCSAVQCRVGYEGWRNGAVQCSAVQGRVWRNGRAGGGGEKPACAIVSQEGHTPYTSLHYTTLHYTTLQNFTTLQVTSLHFAVLITFAKFLNVSCV